MTSPSGDEACEQIEIPAMVRQAEAQARRLGFSQSCLPETRHLLQTLVAARPGGRIAELGAGCGYGSAWIVRALAPTASYVTVEIEPRYAEVVQKLLAPFENACVIAGDWREALACGQFDLIFVDVSEAKLAAAGLVVEALAPGGIAVVDDLTPVEHWPVEWRGNPDPVRDFWLNDERLVAMELAVTPRHAAILATRRR